MKLGRGLAVIFWLITVIALDFIGTLMGGDLNSFESILLLAFIIAWCNDE